MAIKTETQPVVNCANCKIPLASYCSRTKLSNEIYMLQTQSTKTAKQKETVLYELFAQIFKLRQTVVSSLNGSVKSLELCRYCTSNLLNLLKYYGRILKVSNETESLFSRLIVQSKGRPGRPAKKPIVATIDIVENDHCSGSEQTSFFAPTKLESDVVDVDIDLESHLLEDAPLGLQYLGLIRKKRVMDLDLEVNNDGSDNNFSPKRSTRFKDRISNEVASLNLDLDLLLPECSASELTSGEIIIGNPGIVHIDETLKEPIFSSPDKIEIPYEPIADIAEGRNIETEFGPIQCQYCDKTFYHSQRLHYHVKTHHEVSPSPSARMPSKITKNTCETSFQERKIKSSKAKFILLKKKRGRPPKGCLKSSLPSLQHQQLGIVTSKGNSSVDSVAIREMMKKKAVTGVRTGVGINKLKTQNPREEFVCKICKKKFKQSQFLKQHMKVHSNDKRCTECDKKFKSAALLKRHMQIHASDTSVFKCDDCDREFPNLLGLQVHAVAHTRTIYTCKGCKRKFKIEKNFIQHQETARCTEKKHACPTCGKLFKNKDKVKRHLISMHSETKPFGCDLCGKGFRSLADLKFHEVNAHICGETKQYQCEQCGKRFKSVETLKSHEMYSHKMEKRHCCSTCGKGFPLLATLKIHEISHSTDRPYMCTYCGRTYKHANDLKSHEVVHYKDEEKPFVCPICGNRYHRKDVLRLHQGREKHFGPDVPIPPAPKRPSTAAKSKAQSKATAGMSKMFKIDNFETLDRNDALYDESGDSNESGTPLIPTEGVVGTSGISVIQNLNSQIASSSSLSFVQTQLNSVMHLQQQSPTSNQTVTVTHQQHLIPIMQHSSINPLNPSQQSLGSIAQSSFGVPMPPVNEAISDFYRIMYDLT